MYYVKSGKVYKNDLSKVVYLDTEKGGETIHQCSTPIKAMIYANKVFKNFLNKHIKALLGDNPSGYNPIQDDWKAIIPGNYTVFFDNNNSTDIISIEENGIINIDSDSAYPNRGYILTDILVDGEVIVEPEPIAIEQEPVIVEPEIKVIDRSLNNDHVNMTFKESIAEFDKFNELMKTDISYNHFLKYKNDPKGLEKCMADYDLKMPRSKEGNDYARSIIVALSNSNNDPYIQGDQYFRRSLFKSYSAFNYLMDKISEDEFYKALELSIVGVKVSKPATELAFSYMLKNNGYIFDMLVSSSSVNKAESIKKGTYVDNTIRLWRNILLRVEYYVEAMYRSRTLDPCKDIAAKVDLMLPVISKSPVYKIFDNSTDTNNRSSRISSPIESVNTRRKYLQIASNNDPLYSELSDFAISLIAPIDAFTDYSLLDTVYEVVTNNLSGDAGNRVVYDLYPLRRGDKSIVNRFLGIKKTNH